MHATVEELLNLRFLCGPHRIKTKLAISSTQNCILKLMSTYKNCIEGKKPPEDGCMEPKHVVEEEQEI
jgi:hypothetical protein